MCNFVTSQFNNNVIYRWWHLRIHLYLISVKETNTGQMTLANKKAGP